MAKYAKLLATHLLRIRQLKSSFEEGSPLETLSSSEGISQIVTLLTVVVINRDGHRFDMLSYSLEL